MLNKGPVVVAIAAAYLGGYETGIMNADNSDVCPLSPQVDHAVVAVGYKIDQANPANSYIKFKNSWGTGWGEQGYFRMKLNNTLI